MREANELVEVARRAADRAARYIRAARRPAASEWTEKGHHDFVTRVDRAAEELIAAELTRAVPGSVVVGEELSPGAARAGDVVWIVDPLDGTTNFLHGYAHYAVSVACVARGALAAGVVHDVPRDVVYHAAAGGGAWAGEARLAVSTVREPRASLVGTGFPFRHPEEVPRYLTQLAAVMRAAAGVRRAGSAALDLADVAAGRFEAFWELSLAPWDVAAGVLLVREAGGVVTTLEGDPDVLRPGSIVAGSPAMHAWLRGLVQEDSGRAPPTHPKPNS